MNPALLGELAIELVKRLQPLVASSVNPATVVTVARLLFSTFAEAERGKVTLERAREDMDKFLASVQSDEEKRDDQITKKFSTE